MGLNFHLLFF